MRENRPSGSEGGGTEPNRCSRPLSSLASLTESNPRAMRNRGDDRCGANRTRKIITSFLPAHKIRTASVVAQRRFRSFSLAGGLKRADRIISGERLKVSGNE